MKTKFLLFSVLGVCLIAAPASFAQGAKKKDATPWTTLLSDKSEAEHEEEIEEVIEEVEEPKVPDNRPLPQVTIPHSERTRSNVIDIVIDLALTSYFRRFTSFTFKYEFFEFLYDGSRLMFTNPSLTLDLPRLKGTIKVNKLEISVSELIMVLKNKGINLHDVTFRDLDVDLAFFDEAGKKVKTAKGTSEFLNFQTLVFAEEQEKTPRRDDEDADLEKIIRQVISAEKISLSNASASLTNPKETYKTKALTANNVRFVIYPEVLLDFSEAFNNGLDFYTVEDLKKALKK